MANAADGYLGDYLPHKAKCGCTDCQLDRETERNITLESRLSALQQSRDRLLGALKKAVICDTCEGSKELECPPCCNCYGELQCTHTGETIDCPACNGTGLNDMPDAIAAIAEATLTEDSNG